MDIKTLYSILNKFTGNGELRPALAGVLHNDGYLIASDAYLLTKVHYEEYDFDLEGITLDQSGKEIKEKYPSLKSVFPDQSTMDELRDEYVESIRFCLRNIPKGSRNEDELVLLNIEGLLFHTFELSLVFELFDFLNEIPSMFFGKSLQPAVFQSQNCTVLIKSEIRDLTKTGGILFNVDQALAIDLPKLLFNAYRVPQQ